MSFEVAAAILTPGKNMIDVWATSKEGLWGSTESQAGTIEVSFNPEVDGLKVLVYWDDPQANVDMWVEEPGSVLIGSGAA